MLSKNEIKDIQSLSQKKFREELKLFVAEGPKIVAELISLVPSQVKTVYATRDWIKLNAGIDTVSVSEISAIELAKISRLQTPNQVVAVLHQFAERIPTGSSFIIYLDTIQDPGNLGTIIRTADWFNISDIVCSAGCADLYNFKTVQATMSSIARVNVYYDKNEEWLSTQELPVFAARLSGKSLYSFEKTGQGILIIGNESRGIRPAVLKHATEIITIPKKGGAESLNAAVATGIILSHLLT